MNLFRTTLEFVVKDRGTAALGRMQQSTEGAARAAMAAQQNFKALAGAFTSLVVAAKVRGALQAVIDPARKMDRAIARLGFTSGKSAQEIKAMRMNAEKMAEITAFGPQEVMDATVQLNRVLRGTEETMLAVNVATKLAQASFGKMSLESSAQMVAEMGKSFGMSADQIKAAGDKIFALSRSTGVGVEHFAKVMGKLGMSSALAGQSFDDVSRAFAVSSRLLTSPLQAANLMMTTFAKLSTDKTHEALRALGVEALDAQQRIRPISDILQEVAASANLNATETRDRLVEAFGVRALKPMVSMLGAMQKGMKLLNSETGAEEFIRGPEVFDKLAGAQAKTADALDKGVLASMKNADAQMRRAGEAWGKLKTSIGSFLLEALYPVAEVLGTVVGGLSKVLNELGPVGRMVVRSALVITAFGAAWASLRWTLAGGRDILKAVGSRIGMFTKEMKANTVETVKNSLATRVSTRVKTAWGAALEATTVKTKGLRHAVVALKFAAKGLVSVLGLGILAFLPEIYNWIKKNTEAMSKWITKIVETGKGLKKLADKESMFIIGGTFEMMRKFTVAASIAKKRALFWQKIIERERMLREKSAKIAASSLILGTKAFERTVNKLEGLMNAKPKAIKLTDVIQAQDWLKKVIATPVGKEIITPSGYRRVVTAHMRKLADVGLQSSQAAMTTLMNASKIDPKTGRQKGMKGDVAAKVNESLLRLYAGVVGTADPKSKKLLQAAQAPGLAASHQMKKPQIGLRTYQSRMSGIYPKVAGEELGGVGLRGVLDDVVRVFTGKQDAARGIVGPTRRMGTGAITDRGVQITAESEAQQRIRAERESAKELKEINGEMKQLLNAVKNLQQVGIKIEAAKDPGGLPFSLVPARP